MIEKANLGTPHMDGNTRLCTATAAAALKESFGSDGQPGSYSDIEATDAVFLFGHNMAETQTVLWMRVLDRVDGPNPPKIVVARPRMTKVAKAARATGGVHLAPLPGTNQALMNVLTREVIRNGWLDEDYVAAQTLGFDELKAVVEPYAPEPAAAICRVPAEDIRRVARIFLQTLRPLTTGSHAVRADATGRTWGRAGCRPPKSAPVRPVQRRSGRGVRQPRESIRSLHACSQRRQASAHTRQWSCWSAWRPHSSAQALQTVAHAWRIARVMLAS